MSTTNHLTNSSNNSIASISFKEDLEIMSGKKENLLENFLHGGNQRLHTSPHRVRFQGRRRRRKKIVNLQKLEKPLIFKGNEMGRFPKLQKTEV